MVKMQNFVILIQIASLLCKNMIFTKILQKMLKQDLTLQILKQPDHYLKEKIKVIELMKDELGGQIMKEFVRLRLKTYSYLKDNNDEDKKAKGTEKCVIKRKLKFQDFKNCFEAAQIEKKINYLRKNKLMQIVLKRIKKNS